VSDEPREEKFVGCRKVSLVILGFGLLSISEGFAGELSEKEMNTLRGGGCVNSCVPQTSMCKTRDGCSLKEQEECRSYSFIQGFKNDNFACTGTSCVSCIKSDYKQCTMTFPCIWSFSRCVRHPATTTDTSDGYNKCTSY